MRTKILMLVLFVGVALQLSAADEKKAAPDKAMVERGAYLVNFGGCNDCHTPKKFGPNGPTLDTDRLLSGHPADAKVPEVPDGVLGPGKWAALTNEHQTAWAGPWGISFTQNLTPDVETGLGSWTQEMFIEALRTGNHMGQGRLILPPMPWQGIGQLNDADLKAIFAYLQSVKPIHNAVPDPIPPAAEPAHEHH